jgi:hypothetical protein
MSRRMRQEFGIAVPERAIGIAAHDFAQALGAPLVALTRATRREGVPTVPSRWLLRLDTVLRAVGLDEALGPEPEIAAAAALRDQPARRHPSPTVAPCPPLAARPRRLSVTQIETWIRDPYAIYARHTSPKRSASSTPTPAGPKPASLQPIRSPSCSAIRILPPAEAELIEIGGPHSARSCRGPGSGRSGGRASSGSPAGLLPRSGCAAPGSPSASASAGAAS